MPTITYTEELVTVVCTCGINFAVPRALKSQALDHRGPSGKHIYCPLGHLWHYSGKTEADKLREQLATERTRIEFWREEAEAKAKQLRTTKGQLTKARKRAQAGVCPCCNRSFVQLARHMKSKHPGFEAGLLERLDA
ncbi:MAG: hypothetical protein LC750_07605 [Actinobacteria bacterium]|nr:hypothetical protein [Actinomycetota bacterium]